LRKTDGKLTHFVSGIGTGGTLTGVGRRLKKEIPGVEIVQIVPEDFPGIEGLKPLESPGDIIPKILDSSVVDHKVECPARMRSNGAPAGAVWNLCRAVFGALPSRCLRDREEDPQGNDRHHPERHW
jgi:hypothetical protein